MPGAGTGLEIAPAGREGVGTQRPGFMPCSALLLSRFLASGPVACPRAQLLY